MSIKVFGKSALIYSIGTIAARVSTFVLIPIYTHYLSMDTYGLLSLLLLSVQVLGTVIDFGLLKSLMRFVPEYNKLNKAGELLGSSLVLNLLSGIFVVLVVLIFSPLVSDNLANLNNTSYIILLTCLAAFSQSYSLNLISYFRAQNDAKWYTILSFLTALLTLVSGYIFIVKLNMDLIGAILAYILSYTIIIIFTLIKLALNYKFSYTNKTLFQLARYGFPLIFARSGDLIAGLVAMSFLSAFVSLQEVAIYNLASKIATIMSLVMVLPFQLALEPYVFNNIGAENLKNNLSKIATYIVLVFLILSYLLIYISPFLVSLLAPPEYEKAYYIIIFILPIYLFQSFGYFGQSLLHINKKSNIIGSIILIMTLLSISTSYFLIKYFGLPGLILNLNLNYIVTAALLFYFGRKEFKVTLEVNRILILTISFIILSSNLIWIRSINLLTYYLVVPFILAILLIILFNVRFLTDKEKNLIYYAFRLPKLVKRSNRN